MEILGYYNEENCYWCKKHSDINNNSIAVYDIHEESDHLICEQCQIEDQEGLPINQQWYEMFKDLDKSYFYDIIGQSYWYIKFELRYKTWYGICYTHYRNDPIQKIIELDLQLGLNFRNTNIFTKIERKDVPSVILKLLKRK